MSAPTKERSDARETSRVVVVEWVDSSMQHGQVGRDDYPVPERIVSVGWLIHENDDHVLIARDSHRADEFRGLLAIPQVSVIRLKHAGVAQW